MKLIQFSKEGCPPCKSLKNYFKDYENYKYIDVYNDELTDDEQLMFDHMVDNLKYKSFPMLVTVEENNTRYIPPMDINYVKLKEIESKLQ